MKTKKCPRCNLIVCETDGTEICFLTPNGYRACIELKKRRYETIKCACGEKVKIYSAQENN